MKYYTLKTYSVKPTPIILLVSIMFVMLAIFIANVQVSPYVANTYEFGQTGVLMLVGMATAALSTVLVIATSK